MVGGCDDHKMAPSGPFICTVCWPGGSATRQLSRADSATPFQRCPPIASDRAASRTESGPEPATSAAGSTGICTYMRSSAERPGVAPDTVASRARGSSLGQRHSERVPGTRSSAGDHGSIQIHGAPAASSARSDAQRVPARQ